jgi:hypothetical protein
MPGPVSSPKAKTKDGRIVVGKTAIKNSGLRSRENMKTEDWSKA